jgi:hypothetical protein
MKLIGVSGLARSGKDLFTTVAQDILKERGLKTERFALAYELKSDLKDLIYKKTGIDVFTENTEEKTIIRPLLVAYGDVMRKISGGKYWTQKMEQRIGKSKADVVFITDIRYDYYVEDECTWLQYKQAGKLIHITRFKYDISSNKKKEAYDEPPNEHELINNPKVKSRSDYSFEWEDYSNKYPSKEQIVECPYIVNNVKTALEKIGVLSSNGIQYH